MTNICKVGFRRWGHVNISGTIKELYDKARPGAFHATRRNIVEFCSETLDGRLYFPETKPLYTANVVDAKLSADEVILEGFLPGRIARRIAGGSQEMFGFGIAGIESVLDIVSVAYHEVLTPEQYNKVVVLRQVYARSFSDVPVPWILWLSQEKLASLTAEQKVKVVQTRDLRFSGGTFSELAFAGRFNLRDFEVYADPDPREISYTPIL